MTTDDIESNICSSKPPRLDPKVRSARQVVGDNSRIRFFRKESALRPVLGRNDGQNRKY